MRRFSGLLAAVLLLFCAASAQMTQGTSKLKDEMRMPWTRSNERFIRQWLVLSEIPISGASGFDTDWLADSGGEAGIRPSEKMEHKLPDGSKLQWRDVTAWGDATDLSNGRGLKRNLAGYAFATVTRKDAGKVRLSIGSDESVRVWVNGKVVLDKRTTRPLTFDEDQIDVDMKAGANALLVKLEQQKGPWTFSARVLESGAIPPRVQEIGPAIVEETPSAVVIKTDINGENAAQDRVTVQAVAAGGRIAGEKIAARGEAVRFAPSAWPDGAYEFRCSTRKMNGLLYATHIPWYKGDSIAAARKVVAAGGSADTGTPAGQIAKMLGDLITDRLGKDLDGITGNPWWAIHPALMEYEELRLEAAGKPARDRGYGFVRLAYRDEVDGSPQFCRAYLPGGYDRSKKWPLVVKIHGYNPENPEYVRWWSVDTRHNMADVEYAGRQGVIYMEPHGRGNTTYLGLGDQDIVRVIKLAKERFSVDDDRVYLVGDSMGGWGTWNVATRHPDLFAAIAPIYGGADYHSQLSEAELAKLSPLERFLEDKGSSWAMADDLLHMPILVHHGDVDRTVNVDFSRYGVRMLERWGYNVRYIELPGFGHEDLNILGNVIDWLVEHRRVSNPARVRIRSAELQNASAYWAKVERFSAPGEFMEVDAEITAPNTIRLDTRNVLSMTLTPGGALVDAAKPVKVVWNGEPRSLKVQDGALRLRAAAYDETPLEKTATAAGPLGDVFNTPFAIVTGTVSQQPGMKQICIKKSDALAAFWKEWQRQPARVFKDTELSDADAARYSLILVGGADANLISRKLAGKLPLKIDGESVTVGDRSFKAQDARVQMVYPNPLNPQRYVVVIAATSADGMFFWVPDRLRNAEFDFTIEDGHVPNGMERVPSTDIRIASGWFDRKWSVRDAVIHEGNPEVRAKSALLRAPRPDLAIDPKILDAYAGGYQVGPGVVAKVSRTGQQLAVQVRDQPSVDLVPVSETEFFIVEAQIRITFEKDSSGKVAALKVWQNGREFRSPKVE